MNRQKLHTLRSSLQALVPYMEKRLSAGAPQGSGKSYGQCRPQPRARPQGQANCPMDDSPLDTTQDYEVRRRSARRRLDYGDCTFEDSFLEEDPCLESPERAAYMAQMAAQRRLEFDDTEETCFDFDENPYDTPPEYALDLPIMSSTQYNFCEGQQVFNSSLNRRPSFGPQIANSTTYLESCQTMQPLGRFLSMEYSSDFDETQPGNEQCEPVEAPPGDICPGPAPIPNQNPLPFGDACPDEGAFGEPFNNQFERNDVDYMTPWPNPDETCFRDVWPPSPDESSSFGDTGPDQGGFVPQGPNQGDFGEPWPNQGGAPCPNLRVTPPCGGAQSPNQGGDSGGQGSVENLYTMLLDRTAEATKGNPDPKLKKRTIEYVLLKNLEDSPTNLQQKTTKPAENVQPPTSQEHLQTSKILL